MNSRYLIIIFIIESLIISNALAFNLNWEKPNIILITLDTTRADHLGIYGYKRNVSPNIDKISSGCVIFDQAITPVPLTLPSHVSILTGTYPYYHNVRDNNNFQLNSDAITLAEVLLKEGYKTAAFVAAFVLHRKFGLSQGFQIFNDDFSLGRRTALIYAEKDAKAVTDSAIQWLSTFSGEKPLFLWVHYYDPHEPYEAPQEFVKKIGNDYDAEIAYMDSEFIHLFNYLQKRNLLKNALLIIAGDHGEGLGEHNEKYHGIFLYDSVLKVPLLICNENLIKKVKKVSSQVSLLDIFPTVLDFIGIKGYKNIQGKSLLPILNNEDSAEYPIYLETLLPFLTYSLSPMEGIRTSKYKLIKSPKPELYDLKKDSKESHNLFSNLIEERKNLERKMSIIKNNIPTPLQSKSPNLDSESRTILHSLGYLSGPAMKRNNKTNLEDPKDHILIFDKFTDAQDAIGKGKFDEAIEILNNIKKELPSNHLANFMLGVAYMHSQKYDEALKMFTKEAEFYKEIAQLNIGNVYYKMQLFQKAENSYLEAIKNNPYLLEAYILLAEIYIFQNRINDAAAILKKADSLKINDAKLRFLQGTINAIENNYQKAKEYFNQAIQLNPYYGMAYASLGKIALESGEGRKAIAYYKKATALMPKNKEIILTLASLYLMPGSENPKAAYEYYKRALDIDPAAADAEKIKKVMRELEVILRSK